MSRVTVGLVAKWVWVTAVLAFVVVFGIDKWALILDAVPRLSVAALFGAALLIFLGKLTLVTNMLIASRRFSIDLRWRDGYCIYNLTQLAKYVPGSVWHFVGRIAMLRARKASAASIRDALVAEHAWVIGSAMGMAVVLVWASQSDFFTRWLAWAGLLSNWPWWSLVIILLGVGCGAALRFAGWWSRVARWLLGLLPPVRVLPVLILTWLSLGASLWVTLVPFLESGPSSTYVLGVYCFAYVVGFLVPFAPAGLGVREAVLTLALAPYLNMELTVFLVAVNRLLYFGVEILAASVCFFVVQGSHLEDHKI